MRKRSGLQQTLVRYLRCPDLMNQMMERVGVDPDDASCVDGGLAWLEAGTKCTFCRNVDICRSWFAGSDTRTVPSEFCPNTEFFDFCAEDSSADAGVATDAELMPWRLQQLGLDPSYVKVCRPSTYQHLDRACASCKSRRLCARDLAHGNVESGMRSYCPNAPTIDALIISRYYEPRRAMLP